MVFIKEISILINFATMQPYDGIQVFQLPFRPFVERAVNYGIVVSGIDEKNLILDGFGFSLIEEPKRARQ